MKPTLVLAVCAVLLGTPVYAQLDQSLCVQCLASTREKLKKCLDAAISHSQLELNRSTLEFELPGAVRHGGITPAQVMPPLSSYQSHGRISDSTTLRDTQRAVDAIIERQHSGQSAPVYRPRERDDSGQRQLEETRRAVQEFHEQHRLP